MNFVINDIDLVTFSFLSYLTGSRGRRQLMPLAIVEDVTNKSMIFVNRNKSLVFLFLTATLEQGVNTKVFIHTGMPHFSII